MKTILLFSLMISSVALAVPQFATPIRTSVEIESSCRVKAKEIAAETYRSCVTDQKNSQIEQIKKDYQAKLQALKVHYELEIKKLGGAKTKASLEESESAESPADKSEPKMEEHVNGVNSAASPKAPVAPNKKAGKIPLGSKKMAASAAKKASKKSGSSTDSEMTVQLKPAPVTPPADESVMDIPEPVPVENLKTDSAI